MRKISSVRSETDRESEALRNFLEELRESFTSSFAYDRFDWPAAQTPSSAIFQPLTVKPAPGGTKPQDSAGEDPVSLYTSNADVPVFLTGQVMSIEGDAGIVPETNRSGPLVAIDDFRADARFAGIDGSGYTVAVLDTGIDLDDPFFGPDANGDGISDRIVYQYDFADGDASAADIDGHGSNVSSIVASSDATYGGMAPGAGIAALKVFQDSGSGYFSYIEDALQWVILNAEAYNIVSVNMSLSDSGNYSTAVTRYGIADEMATLAAMDVIVVSASGNAFYGFNSVQGVAYPSADPNSLSVGAVYEGSYGSYNYSGPVAYSTGADRITPFSQRDDQLSDIFAPGAPITGAGAGAALTTMHGTSQAAPHIAGIIALAQQLAEQELGRKLTFDEVAQLLEDSADTILDGDDEDDNVTNTGLEFPRVDVLGLGEAILAMADPAEPETFFSIAEEDTVLAEGDSGTTTFTFSVWRSGDTSAAGSVDYAVTGGSADADDFLGGVLPSGTVNFAENQIGQAFTIEVNADALVEGDETFTVTLSNPSANSGIQVGSAEGIILNDDVSPAASFSIAADDTVKDEGDVGTTPFSFVVTRSGDTASPGTVDYTVVGTTADGDDFAGGALPSGTLSFAAGEASKTLVFDIAGDNQFEADEGFYVRLENASEGHTIGEAYAIATILNDDQPKAISIAAEDAVKLEGDAAATDFTFTVTRAGDASEAVTVDWAVSGSDVDGADFAGGVLPSGSVSFAVGETSKTVTVQVAGDSDFEGDESFTVTLSNASDGTEITTASADGTILNDDSVRGTTYFFASAYDAVKPEGDGGTTEFTFLVTRSGDTTEPDSIDYTVSGSGGAPADASDFAGGILPSGKVTFAAGETGKIVTIEVVGDSDVEPEENFTLTISNPPAHGMIQKPSGEATIENDDFPPEGPFVILDADFNGSFAGTDGFTFEEGIFTEPGDSDMVGGGWSAADLIVNIGFSETPVEDLNGGWERSFTLDQELELTLSFLYDVVHSATFEADETLQVLVSIDGGPAILVDQIAGSADDSAAYVIDPTTAGLNLGVFGPGEHSIAIGGLLTKADSLDEYSNLNIDDVLIIGNLPSEVTGFLSIAAEDAVKEEGDAGTTAYTFTVTRSGDTSEAASADWAVTGDAVDAADFAGGVWPGGTVNFAAGEVSKTITVEVAGDSGIEDDEGFTVTLSNASTGSEITTASAQGTILNDDTPPLGPVTVIDETFDSDSGGFAFQDGGFGGASPQDYADGAWADGALQIDLGGIDKSKAADMSGGWTTTFSLEAESDVSLSFLYELMQSSRYEKDEYSQVLLSVDGGPAIVVDTLTGDGNKGDALTTGQQTFSIALGTLAAGDHSLTIGGYNNKKTWFDEFTDIMIDDVTATATAVAPPPPPPPPADTSYAITADDAILGEGDDGTTAFTFTVTRSGDLTGTGSVDYSVAGAGSAAADGDDFLGDLLPSGTVTFDTPGESEATIVIEVAGDLDFESDESFTVILSNPAAGGEVIGDPAAATILNDDPEPEGEAVLVSADFDASGDTEGFVYSDGVFGGDVPQALADGSWDSGALSIVLGGGENNRVNNMSGAWEIDVTLANDMDVSLAFSYELLISGEYEGKEYSQVLVSLDGGAAITVDELFGDGGGGPDLTTGLQDVTLDLGPLDAGTHTIAIGGYNNRKTWSDEITEVTIDDVTVTGTVSGAGLSETELLATAGI